MKINFLGDSITAGAGASVLEKSYVRLVESTLGCEVRNYGISGTRIAKQSKPSAMSEYDLDFQMRAKEMDEDADWVFVFGGTNDWGHGDGAIGEFGDNNPYTFYGGLQTLIEILLKKYPKEKLTFLLPLRRYGDENPYGEGNKEKPSLPLRGYAEILKTVLEAYKIKYLDFYENGLPTPLTGGESEWFSDGVHPNDKGHIWLAGKIVEYITSKEKKQ